LDEGLNSMLIGVNSTSRREKDPQKRIDGSQKLLRIQRQEGRRSQHAILTQTSNTATQALPKKRQKVFSSSM